MCMVKSLRVAGRSGRQAREQQSNRTKNCAGSNLVRGQPVHASPKGRNRVPRGALRSSGYQNDPCIVSKKQAQGAARGTCEKVIVLATDLRIDVANGHESLLCDSKLINNNQCKAEAKVTRNLSRQATSWTLRYNSYITSSSIVSNLFIATLDNQEHIKCGCLAKRCIAGHEHGLTKTSGPRG